MKNEGRSESALPLPPPELRELVGVTDEQLYQNVEKKPVFEDVPLSVYRSVFDFGCGCGRIARMLIQQDPQPEKYVGVDLHRGMVNWCTRNLTSVASQFEFQHQDVVNVGFNPRGTQKVVGFPVEDGSVTLFVAWSVFTHVNQSAAEFYLSELARVLHPDGIAITTWFLFDKTEFPMMQEFQNALFINDTDPTNAVIFDKDWLRETATQRRLRIAEIVPPAVRGFQWRIRLEVSRGGSDHVPFPEDRAPTGRVCPPLTPEGAADLEV